MFLEVGQQQCGFLASQRFFTFLHHPVLHTIQHAGPFRCGMQRRRRRTMAAHAFFNEKFCARRLRVRIRCGRSYGRWAAGRGGNYEAATQESTRYKSKVTTVSHPSSYSQGAAQARESRLFLYHYPNDLRFLIRKNSPCNGQRYQTRANRESRHRIPN